MNKQMKEFKESVQKAIEAAPSALEKRGYNVLSFDDSLKCWTLSENGKVYNASLCTPPSGKGYILVIKGNGQEIIFL